MPVNIIFHCNQFQLATKHMDIDKVNAMSLNQAKTLEEKGKLREAEKLVDHFIVRQIFFNF